MESFIFKVQKTVAKLTILQSYNSQQLCMVCMSVVFWMMIIQFDHNKNCFCCKTHGLGWAAKTYVRYLSFHQAARQSTCARLPPAYRALLEHAATASSLQGVWVERVQPHPFSTQPLHRMVPWGTCYLSSLYDLTHPQKILDKTKYVVGKSCSIRSSITDQYPFILRHWDAPVWAEPRLRVNHQTVFSALVASQH